MIRLTNDDDYRYFNQILLDISLVLVEYRSFEESVHAALYMVKPEAELWIVFETRYSVSNQNFLMTKNLNIPRMNTTHTNVGPK